MKNRITAILLGVFIITGCEDETDPFINTVTVTPQTATVEVNETQQFLAELKDENGDAISGTIIWSVSDAGLASISETGLATGLSEGNVTITATAGGKTGTASLSVGVGSVLLSPSAGTMTISDTLRILATYVSLSGDTVNNPTVTWSSDDVNVVSVNSSGLLTALSTGTATITAAHQTGTVGSVIITVEDVGSFNLTMVDNITTGDASQSSPELIRFINSNEGVIVNSMQNTLDFISITTTSISLSGESLQITDDPDAECSSVDVSVDESIIAVVVTKGACTRGQLYLVDASSRTKYGPYELGYNPDAVDIAVDNQFVVVVNEFDYEDGVDGGCNELGFPGVSVYDISNGLASATSVVDMKITHTGTNGNLAEPEGVKIAPDGETVYMTLQESNEMGWFSILSPPDTLKNYVTFTNPEHEPDGIWVNSDGTIVCTGGEYDGTIGVIQINADGTPGTQTYAVLANDLPSNWTWTDERKGIEPEEVVIVEEGSKTFVMTSLQDPGGVVVYNITDPTNPVYDSGAIVEMNDYTTVEGGESAGEPEGLAYKNGYVLVSNTADPSVSLLKASWAE